MKKLILSAIAVLFVSFGTFAQTPEVWSSLKKDANFFMANDLGKNGYYDQKKIAELMGVMAEEIGPDSVLFHSLFYESIVHRKVIGFTK